ncbi:MAG: ATP-binding protein [Candidatus Marinimicrobia bacterium]|nr:ATP-binding protein [Candidatus Neomarinimicrobiota bacterium]
MKYLNRHLEKEIREIVKQAKVVLILGARQVGKSTLIKYLFPGYRIIEFDPVTDLMGEREDPVRFLDNFPSPLILDEIQYVPKLLSAIKRKVDGSDSPGQYILTGSQNLMLLKNVSETLAGRVMILSLYPFSLRELTGDETIPDWFRLMLKDDFTSLIQTDNIKKPSITLYRTLWRGMMPGVFELDDKWVHRYMQSYNQTYIQRDVRVLSDLNSAPDFDRFFRLMASLSAHEINYSQLGREIGITPKTAKAWLSLLVQTYQWRELAPWHGNTIKRISGKTKGILADTGLLCYLHRISNWEILGGHPLLGRIFETWVLNQIYNYCEYLNYNISLYHWRTAGGAEVDGIIYLNGKLFPVEVKASSRLCKHDTRGIRAFRDTYGREATSIGIIFYAGDTCYKISEDAIAVPWFYL